MQMPSVSFHRNHTNKNWVVYVPVEILRKYNTPQKTYHSTEAEAREHARRVAEAAAMPLVRMLHRMATQDLVRVASCLQHLGWSVADLERAVFTRPPSPPYQPPSNGEITVREAIDRYMEALSETGRRPATIRYRRISVTRTLRDVMDKKCGELSKSDFWLPGGDASYRYIDTISMAGRLFAKFCMKSGYMSPSAIPDPPPKPGLSDRPMVQFMSVEDVEFIFRWAEVNAPKAIPVLVMRIFCGIRPTTSDLLDWSHIDMNEKVIRIPPEYSKTRRGHIVHIAPNAMEWLRAYHLVLPPRSQSCHPIPKMMRLMAGIRPDMPRIPDVMRHTYVTHLVPIVGVQMASLEADNSPKVLMRHYRGLVSSDRAQRFWSIRPSSGAQLADAAAQGQSDYDRIADWVRELTGGGAVRVTPTGEIDITEPRNEP